MDDPLDQWQLHKVNLTIAGLSFLMQWDWYHWLLSNILKTQWHLQFVIAVKLIVEVYRFVEVKAISSLAFEQFFIWETHWTVISLTPPFTASNQIRLVLNAGWEFMESWNVINAIYETNKPSTHLLGLKGKIITEWVQVAGKKALHALR